MFNKNYTQFINIDENKEPIYEPSKDLMLLRRLPGEGVRLFPQWAFFLRDADNIVNTFALVMLAALVHKLTPRCFIISSNDPNYPITEEFGTKNPTDKILQISDDKLAELTHVPKRVLRYALNHLESANFVRFKTKNKKKRETTDETSRFEIFNVELRCAIIVQQVLAPMPFINQHGNPEIFYHDIPNEELYFIEGTDQVAWWNKEENKEEKFPYFYVTDI